MLNKQLVFLRNTLIALSLAVICSCIANADQTDSRLDTLFALLQKPTLPQQMQAIEAEIWQIWTDSGRSDVNELMTNGIRDMQARKFDQALRAFNDIIDQLPKFAEGWNKRATLHYLRNDYAASMRDVQRTLELEPRHFGALSGMGLIFMETGDPVGAIKAFEEVLKVHPHSPSARANIDRLQENVRDKVI